MCVDLAREVESFFGFVLPHSSRRFILVFVSVGYSNIHLNCVTSLGKNTLFLSPLLHCIFHSFSFLGER